MTIQKVLNRDRITCTYFKNAFCRVCAMGEDTDAVCFTCEPIPDLPETLLSKAKTFTADHARQKIESRPMFAPAYSFGNYMSKPNTNTKVSKTKRQIVLERDGNKCLSCGTTEKLTLDHIVPKAKGGDNETTNLQTLCKKCNLLKGTRIRDYRQVNQLIKQTMMTEKEVVEIADKWAKERGATPREKMAFIAGFADGAGRAIDWARLVLSEEAESMQMKLMK